MSEQCDQHCENCNEACEDRKTEPDLRAHLNKDSRVGKLIAVVSGKGGVGKSSVTSLLAVATNGLGMKTAILDADITGPSIPKAFGIKGKAKGDGTYIFPILSQKNIQIMSVNLLLENDSDPVLWRGPILGGTVKQFWTDVLWDDVDVMFIDMPPGTGDVPLTIFQSLPIDGIVMVTSPQELVGMIVGKAVKMAEMMNVPILGLVENLSYFVCPDTGKEHKVFGESHVQEIAEAHHLPLLARLPIDPALSLACDEGKIEELKVDWLNPVASLIKNLGEKHQ